MYLSLKAGSYLDEPQMTRLSILGYAFLCYALFNATFIYLAGFLLEIGASKTVNSGPATSTVIATVIDLGLIALFGIFHSIMARPSAKRQLTRIIPAAAERSTFVLQSTAFIALLIWQWQPIPGTIWQVDGWAAIAFYTLFGIGTAVVLIATYLIDHYELFGLRQVWSYWTGKPIPDPAFRTPFLYRYVRHPMQTGVLIMFFATPHMTAGHFLLSASMTIYVLIGLQFEERALVRQFGDIYRNYQRDVPMLVPWYPPAFRSLESDADEAVKGQISDQQSQQ